MIEKKKAKCKPSGRAISFASCGKPNIYRFKYGMCEDCFKEWARTTPEGNEYISSVSLSAKKNVDKIQRKEQAIKIKKQKEDLKSISQLKEEVQSLFNKLIRLIDEGQGCISCNHGHPDEYGNPTPFTQKKEAGHYYTKGGHDNIRFNAFNVHLQCHGCNFDKSGNETGYVNGMVDNKGIDYFNKVRSLKSLKSIKIMRSDIPILKKKIRELIVMVSDKEEITREYINEYLELYK